MKALRNIYAGTRLAGITPSPRLGKTLLLIAREQVVLGSKRFDDAVISITKVLNNLSAPA